MHYFKYIKDELYCEGVPIRRIVDKFDTPVYIYSYKTLKRHFEVFDSAFSDIKHLICYSAKANSNLSILRIFINLGGGVDIVSRGELLRALKAGADPKKIVYSGVGKRNDEIASALSKDILMFNVESSEELDAINRIGKEINKRGRIALRVNPDIDPKTHPYISTGLKKNKFGIPFSKAFYEYKRTKDLKNIEIVGIDCHIGSQLTELDPFIDSLKRLKILIDDLKNEGIDVKYLDLGGGLGIRYNDETPPHPDEYAKAIIDEIRDRDIKLIFEPGRVIVGNAGILVTKVLYRKLGDYKNFIIVDAGMNDIIRPALYGAFQDIIPIFRSNYDTNILADIVGPICESSDFIGKDRKLPLFKHGDLIAVMGAGAYGFSMSSNYNSRPRAAEVLVKGEEAFLIRRRESYEDLIRGEDIPDFLR
jgi:diaminopimelate decarboxylase